MLFTSIARKPTPSVHAALAVVSLSAKAPSLESLGAAQTLLADRAYDSDALRKSLAERGSPSLNWPQPKSGCAT
jgi:hypothetical protein